MPFPEQKNRIPPSDKSRLSVGLDRYAGGVTAGAPKEKYVSAGLDPTLPSGTRKVINESGDTFYLQPVA
jgi:hypothetical protein